MLASFLRYSFFGRTLCLTSKILYTSSVFSRTMQWSVWKRLKYWLVHYALYFCGIFFTCMWLVTYICKMLLPLIKKLYKNFAMLEYLFHLFISICSIINFQNKYNHHFMNNVLIIWQSSGTSSKGKRILQYQVCCVLPQKEKFPISSVGDIFLFQTSTYPVVDTYILGIARILQLWPGSLQIRKGNPGKWDLGKVVNLWELFVNV